jgi:hypothetical protein
MTGVHIMIAGLSLQVATLMLFAILCTDFAWKVRKNRGARPSINSGTFRLFQYGEINGPNTHLF